MNHANYPSPQYIAPEVDVLEFKLSATILSGEGTGNDWEDEGDD